MIIDRLVNLGQYRALNPYIGEVIQFLVNQDLNKLEEGTIEISGREVFAMISSYQTHEPEATKWEAHRKYIDIQVPVSGEEYMGFAPLNSMDLNTPYEEEKDIAFYTGKGDLATVSPGQFIMFMPQDAHQPCISIHQPRQMKKIVFKLLVVNP